MVFPLVIQLADILAHLAADTSRVEDSQLIQTVESMAPDLKSQSQSNALVWDEVSIESWFAWILIERTHGSSVVQLFSTQS